MELNLFLSFVGGLQGLGLDVFRDKPVQKYV